MQRARHPRDAHFTGAYQVSSSGSYHPPRDPGTTYPDYPLSELTAVAADPELTRVADLTVRTPFPSGQTAGMIAHAAARPAAFQTPQDRFMMANPAASLSANNISRNHKLADSSVRALIVALWWQMRQAQLTPQERQIVETFFNAMTGGNALAVVYVWNELDTAVASASPQAVVAHLARGIAELSTSYPNLRFGDATTNEQILFAFDPNVHTDGRATPLSEAILTAGKALVAILPREAVEAAFTQAFTTQTGATLSSSTVK